MMKEQYIRIYDSMINELNLTGNTLLVYALIHSYTADNKRCFMTQASIGRMLNIDRSTVHRALDKLLADNLIEIVENDDQANIYELTEYKSTSTCTDGEHFDIFKSYLNKGLAGNALLVYAYLHLNIRANLSKVAEALKLSLNTISQITKELEEMYLFTKQLIRTAKGKFKATICRFHSKNCNSDTSNTATVPNFATHILKDNNNFKEYNKPKYHNKWNNFKQNEYDFEALEAAILAN